MLDMLYVKSSGTSSCPQCPSPSPSEHSAAGAAWSSIKALSRSVSLGQDSSPYHHLVRFLS